MNLVKKIRDELDYWIHIGIADDIVNCRQHRPEYSHIVKKYIGRAEPEDIPGLVLKDLDEELKKPTLLQPTFYYLIYLKALKTKETLCKFIQNTINSLTRKN